MESQAVLKSSQQVFYCIATKALLEQLRAVKFDVFIADMIYNECGLALAHHLDAALPTVGFWAFSFISGEPGKWDSSREDFVLRYSSTLSQCLVMEQNYPVSRVTLAKMSVRVPSKTVRGT